MKVSLICTTYRRYRCIERIIEQFLQQDYFNKELVIFNTDSEIPMSLPESLLEFCEKYKAPIVLVNNSIDYETGLPYTNRGAICRDAVTHSTGELFMLMDDDDIYLPWHARQAVYGIMENGKAAWKPEQSMFATPYKLELVRNTLEASVIVKMEKIKEIGFRTDLTGYEGLSWYTKLRDDRELDEHNKRYVPSYCFNWSDPSDMAGHKQSGDIDNPSNFENHKERSTDVSTKPLDRCGVTSITEVYSKYYEFLLKNKDLFPPDLWEKYAESYVEKSGS